MKWRQPEEASAGGRGMGPEGVAYMGIEQGKVEGLVERNGIERLMRRVECKKAALDF